MKNNNLLKRLMLMVFLPMSLALAGCGERYRYPCQDPENWDEKICKKPFCSANGTCPEDLRHYEKDTTQPQPIKPMPTINTGGCK